jgi:hypothetical protein
MSTETKVLYDFGEFRCDPHERLLLRDGKPVSLSPKAFEILVALIGSNRCLLTKDELMKQVWPDSFVHYGFHTPAFQPLRHLFQGRRPGSELSHRLRIASWRHRHLVAFVAHINTGGMGIDNLQSGIRGVQTTLHFSAFLTIPSQLSIA